MKARRPPYRAHGNFYASTRLPDRYHGAGCSAHKDHRGYKSNESHWIQPGCIIGELQAVEYADTSNMTPEEKKNIDFLHQFKLNKSDLSDAESNQVNELLVEFRDIFSEGDFDIGRASSTTHDIHLSGEKPFKIRHRRIPPGMYNEVKEHLKQLKNTGIIRDSASPWSSPGDLRMCVDYRELNKRTIKD